MAPGPEEDPGRTLIWPLWDEHQLRTGQAANVCDDAPHCPDRGRRGGGQKGGAFDLLDPGPREPVASTRSPTGPRRGAAVTRQLSSICLLPTAAPLLCFTFAKAAPVHTATHAHTPLVHHHKTATLLLTLIAAFVWTCCGHQMGAVPLTRTI